MFKVCLSSEEMVACAWLHVIAMLIHAQCNK